jgi:Fe-S-cluster containining protein
MPDEIPRFLNNTDIVISQGMEFHTLKRVDGVCKFLDNNQRCSIYTERPLECRLYPHVLHRDAQGKPILILHAACPQHTKALQPKLEDIPELNEDWFKAYEALPY